jgi:hypothetical protein
MGKLGANLDSTFIPKHDLGELLIPTVYVFWCCKEYGDSGYTIIKISFNV